MNSLGRVYLVFELIEGGPINGNPKTADLGYVGNFPLFNGHLMFFPISRPCKRSSFPNLLLVKEVAYLALLCHLRNNK